MKKESEKPAPSSVYGFKGFDKDFKCRNFQYEIGKEYTHDGPLKLCSSGFHFVENPLDAFGYYGPSDGHYAEVVARDVSSNTDSDSKRVARSLKVIAEVSLQNLCNLGAKFILSKVDFENAKESNTGDSSAAPLLEHIRWPLGSIVAIRTAGEKLILERIPLEEFARIRVGLTEVRPEST